jgi:hypothetical protein
MFSAFSIFSIACAHTHHIPRNSQLSKFNEINKKLATERVTIFLVDDAIQIEAENVHIASDSVWYLDKKTNIKSHIATFRVNKIIQINQGKGAAEGFGLGLLGGAVIWGAIILDALNQCDDCDEDPHSSSGIVSTGIVIGGGGALISSFIGAAKGSKSIYVLNKE